MFEQELERRKNEPLSARIARIVRQKEEFAEELRRREQEEPEPVLLLQPFRSDWNEVYDNHYREKERRELQHRLIQEYAYELYQELEMPRTKDFTLDEIQSLTLLCEKVRREREERRKIVGGWGEMTID